MLKLKNKLKTILLVVMSLVCMFTATGMTKNATRVDASVSPDIATKIGYFARYTVRNMVDQLNDRNLDWHGVHILIDGRLLKVDEDCAETDFEALLCEEHSYFFAPFCDELMYYLPLNDGETLEEFINNNDIKIFAFMEGIGYYDVINNDGSIYDSAWIMQNWFNVNGFNVDENDPNEGGSEDHGPSNEEAGTPSGGADVSHDYRMDDNSRYFAISLCYFQATMYQDLYFIQQQVEIDDPGFLIIYVLRAHQGPCIGNLLVLTDEYLSEMYGGEYDGEDRFTEEERWELSDFYGVDAQ